MRFLTLNWTCNASEVDGANLAVSTFKNSGGRIIAAALSFALFCWTSAEAANAPPEMSTPGRPSVTSLGAFAYSVPITVPPGTAGVVPMLSLDYLSGSGDGMVGFGWSLAGVPVIVRCPRTISDDGVHGGINYDSNDRFCLVDQNQTVSRIGSQKLSLMSGTYGADGSVYRTQLESFTKIIAHGTAGNGPVWFEVHAKSGQVMQFGNTTNSRILAVGKTTARAWAMNQFTDVKGNYLTVTYTNDSTNGQFYPTRIDYTGNTSQSLATYNSVRFVYISRADVIPTYQAGSLIQSTVLLTDIQTYTGATLTTDYKLAYTAAILGQRHDELASITQCDGTTPTPNCLAPTTFGWQGGQPLSFTTTTMSTLAAGTSLLPVDFNGDGLTDGINNVATSACSTYDLGAVNSNTQDFSMTATAMTLTYTGYSPVAACLGPTALYGGLDDFDGDGKTDLMAPTVDLPVSDGIPQSQARVILLNNGSGSFVQVGSPVT